MRRTIIAALSAEVALAPAIPAGFAHAFLDHANPAVGSVLPAAPSKVTLWFTQELEPAFSTVAVADQNGDPVDAGDVEVGPSDRTVMQVGLKPLPPGTYKVRWRALSVDTHTTEGTFSFRIGP